DADAQGKIDEAQQGIDRVAGLEAVVAAEKKNAADLQDAKDKATAVIGNLPYLSEAEKQGFINRVNDASTNSTVVSVLAEAIKASVNANPNLSQEEKDKYAAALDNAKSLDDIIAENPYTNGSINTEAGNNTTVTNTSGSSSSKIPWWVYLLTILGIGGGVAGWGYVHDADFRAVVDGAIANFQRAVDDALGIRR
ncbi:MAG: hypothetical protein Q3972_06440, partial [Corynebacterium sp.]|nr:hypothetical protein [Corynebacterium sp.]